jgi:hypothetical protein
MHFHRKNRSPRDVRDLILDILVSFGWTKNTSLTSRKLPKSLSYGSEFRKSTVNFDFGENSVFIYGVTDGGIADCIRILLCWKQEGDKDVRIGTAYIHGTDCRGPDNIPNVAIPVWQQGKQICDDDLFLGTGAISTMNKR